MNMQPRFIVCVYVDMLPQIPIAVFKSQESAEEWLKVYRQTHAGYFGINSILIEQ